MAHNTYQIMSGYLIHRWLTILTKIMAGDSIDGSQYNRLFNRWLTIPTNTTAVVYLIDRWLTILTNRLACALTIICQNYKEKSGVPATVHLPSSPRLLWKCTTTTTTTSRIWASEEWILFWQRPGQAYLTNCSSTVLLPTLCCQGVVVVQHPCSGKRDSSNLGCCTTLHWFLECPAQSLHRSSAWKRARSKRHASWTTVSK